MGYIINNIRGELACLRRSLSKLKLSLNYEFPSLPLPFPPPCSTAGWGPCSTAGGAGLRRGDSNVKDPSIKTSTQNYYSVRVRLCLTRRTIAALLFRRLAALNHNDHFYKFISDIAATSNRKFTSTLCFLLRRQAGLLRQEEEEKKDNIKVFFKRCL